MMIQRIRYYWPLMMMCDDVDGAGDDFDDYSEHNNEACLSH